MAQGQLPVLIVGAGPVGCFIAYRLGKAGLSVRIFEKESTIPYTPRAVGYYGATQVAFQEAGLYNLIRAEGFMTAGLCWRTVPTDDDQGGKRLGDMIGAQPLCDPNDPNKTYPSGILNLRQSELTKLLLRKALQTGNVTIQYNSELASVQEEENKITIDFEDKRLPSVPGCYLVGADGGKSKTRKLVNTPCLGHTWPERLISTDVTLHNRVDPIFHTCYIIGLKNYTIMTPLTEPIIGEKSLWRCTIAVPPEDQRSEEELLQEDVIRGLYEHVIAGPRPLQAEISAKSVYRIHQRVVPTMRKGRCILAGDAAHMNNPYGAMGLNTGLLDGDALAEALIMILCEGQSNKILTSYSDARIQVFRNFVDPTTTANKLRLHLPSETAAEDDYYLRSLQNPSPEMLVEGCKPFFETWRTDMREVVKEGRPSRILGTKTNDVVEFLGIQYATLAHQFASPVPINYQERNPDETIDATSYGPSVGGVDGCDSEFALIQHDLPRTHFAQSTTQGLNLNITLPQINDSSEPLPVLVFLHGGGFAVGSPSWPQNQLTNLVSLSSELGLPVVGVSVNYRVGPHGFMTSKEMRDAGLTPNNGLRDQRVALKWVKSYISGFGGDPENITVVGHSAGGVSASLHLANDEPLFKRVACLSGQFLAVKPLPCEVHEHFYAEQVRALGLDTLSPNKRVSRLLDLSTEDLAKISVFPSRPLIDEDVCLEMPSVQAIGRGIPPSLHKGWCRDLFIGDCQFDGSILAGAFDHRKAGIGKSFAGYLAKEVADIPSLADKILSKYGLNGDTQNDDEALHSILELAHDILFYIPTVYLAQAWHPGAAYLYRFNSPNPWKGPWQGEASHITDLSMLLHNFDAFLSDDMKEVGRVYARDLLAFVSGKAPWQAFGGQDPFVREYGNLPGGRREIVWDILKDIDYDRLSMLLEQFIAIG